MNKCKLSEKSRCVTFNLLAPFTVDIPLLSPSLNVYNYFIKVYSIILNQPLNHIFAKTEKITLRKISYMLDKISLRNSVNDIASIQ